MIEFSLHDLQEKQPWTVPYSEEFRHSKSSNPLRQTTHDLLHVVKSLGKIAAACEAGDHGTFTKLSTEELSIEVADLVICALHIANEHNFDLQSIVVDCIEKRNKVKLGE